MKDANPWHTHQDGIVDEVLHGIESLVATHTSDVEILMEVCLVGINGLAGLLADAVGSQVLLTLLGLVQSLGRWGGVLQSVETHLGSHASEYGGSCIATDAFHLAHGSQALDANGIASLNLSIVIYLRLVLCIAQGSGSFFLIFFLLCLSLGTLAEGLC